MLLKQDSKGDSILLMLCIENSPKLAQIIKAYGITRDDLLIRNKLGSYPFKVLCQSNHPGLLKIFEYCKITHHDLLQASKYGYTPTRYPFEEVLRYWYVSEKKHPTGLQIQQMFERNEQSTLEITMIRASTRDIKIFMPPNVLSSLFNQYYILSLLEFHSLKDVYLLFDPEEWKTMVIDVSLLWHFCTDETLPVMSRITNLRGKKLTEMYKYSKLRLFLKKDRTINKDLDRMKPYELIEEMRSLVLKSTADFIKVCESISMTDLSQILKIDSIPCNNYLDTVYGVSPFLKLAERNFPDLEKVIKHICRESSKDMKSKIFSKPEKKENDALRWMCRNNSPALTYVLLDEYKSFGITKERLLTKSSRHLLMELYEGHFDKVTEVVKIFRIDWRDIKSDGGNWNIKKETYSPLHAYIWNDPKKALTKIIEEEEKEAQEFLRTVLYRKTTLYWLLQNPDLNPDQLKEIFPVQGHLDLNDGEFEAFLFYPDLLVEILSEFQRKQWEQFCSAKTISIESKCIIYLKILKKQRNFEGKSIFQSDEFQSCKNIRYESTLPTERNTLRWYLDQDEDNHDLDHPRYLNQDALFLNLVVERRFDHSATTYEVNYNGKEKVLIRKPRSKKGIAFNHLLQDFYRNQQVPCSILVPEAFQVYERFTEAIYDNQFNSSIAADRSNRNIADIESFVRQLEFTIKRALKFIHRNHCYHGNIHESNVFFKTSNTFHETGIKANFTFFLGGFERSQQILSKNQYLKIFLARMQDYDEAMLGEMVTRVRVFFFKHRQDRMVLRNREEIQILHDCGKERLHSMELNNVPDTNLMTYPVVWRYCIAKFMRCVTTFPDYEWMDLNRNNRFSLYGYKSKPINEMELFKHIKDILFSLKHLQTIGCIHNGIVFGCLATNHNRFLLMKLECVDSCKDSCFATHAKHLLYDLMVPIKGIPRDTVHLFRNEILNMGCTADCKHLRSSQNDGKLRKILNEINLYVMREGTEHFSKATKSPSEKRNLFRKLLAMINNLRIDPEPERVSQEEHVCTCLDRIERWMNSNMVGYKDGNHVIFDEIPV